MTAWEVLCKQASWTFDNEAAALIWLVTEHCTHSTDEVGVFDFIDEKMSITIDEDPRPICIENWTPGFHVIQPVQR